MKTLTKNSTEKKTTTFIEQVKKARSLSGINKLIESGRFVCSNPKTLRRWNRTVAERLEKLGVKSVVKVRLAY